MRPWHSVRVRIVATVALLLALALAGAGAVVYAIASANEEAAARDDVDQELAEFSAYLQPESERAAAALPRSLRGKLEDFLRRNVVENTEVMVGWLDGLPALVSAGAGIPDVEQTLLRDPAFQEAAEEVTRGGGSTTTADSDSLGELVVAGWTVRQGDSRGALVVVSYVDLEKRELRDTMQTYALVALGSLVVITLLAAWQSGRLLAPLRVLRATTEEITATDLARRLPEVGNDDITALTRTVNDMLARLEAAFVAQRQFLDDAGHELKTPLTVLRGHLELVDPEDAEEVAATRELLLDEVDRMSRLVEDLILLAKSRRPDFLAPRPVNLAHLTQHVLAKARGMAERDWQLDGSTETILDLDEQRLTQAVLQLVDNAIKHTGKGDTIAVGSSYDEHGARIWVRDTGAGVPESDRAHIFERFGRSVVHEHDEGFGLGLSIVRAIAEAHGGSVHVEDAPHDGPGGAVFVISLPTREEHAWPGS